MNKVLFFKTTVYIVRRAVAGESFTRGQIIEEYRDAGITLSQKEVEEIFAELIYLD